ncbi:MAG: hypothetical protein WCG25_03940 [bacterium]
MVPVESSTGKFNIAETNTITTKNCLIKSLIKYHFINISIPTKIHNPKNILSQISPNAIFAY